MRRFFAVLSLTTLFMVSNASAVVIYDEVTDGDLPNVGNSSNSGNIGTLDSGGAMILGSLLGADNRDSIFFTAPEPFRVRIDDFSGLGNGMIAFGFGPAFPDFPSGIARSFNPPEYLYDGIGSGDSPIAAPTGVLGPGDYRIDFGPIGGELDSYKVTIESVIPEPSSVALSVLGFAFLQTRRRRVS